MLHKIRSLFLAITALLLHYESCKSMPSDIPVVSLPLRVSVSLIGVDFSDVTPERLQNILHGVLPFYSPQNSDIQYEITYRINSDTGNFLNLYNNFVDSRPILSSKGHKIISLESIIEFLGESWPLNDNKPKYYEFSTLSNIPILILSSLSLPKHIIYATSESECTQTIVANVAFIDLSAQPCDIHPVIPHRIGNFMRWNLPNLLQSAPFVFPLDSRSPWDEQHSNTYSLNYKLGKISGMVTSAVQALTTGSLSKRITHTADRIFCPIVILRNGGIHVENHTDAVMRPNLALIKTWLKSVLLPHQELVLLTTTHFVDEHPQISVALSSSTSTYPSTTMSSPGNSLMQTLGMRATPENIPYVDSTVLIRELAGTGDELCKQLLSRSGHGAHISKLLQLQAASASLSEGSADTDILEWMDESNGGTEAQTKTVHKTNKDKGQSLFRRDVAMVPVFVISDLHIHNERFSQSQLTSQSQLQPQNSVDRTNGNGDGESPSSPAVGDTDSSLQEIAARLRAVGPVQPLLDKDRTTAIVDDSVIVLHSSTELVSTYSPTTKHWQQTNLSDIDMLIAEALTKALTGLAPPHLQILETRQIVDLTWTHGLHPFSPFGSMPRSNVQALAAILGQAVVGDKDGNGGQGGYQQVLSCAARRGAIAARAHSVLQHAGAISRRASLLVGDVVGALQILQGVQDKDKDKGEGEGEGEGGNPGTDENDGEDMRSMTRRAKKGLSDSLVAKSIPSALSVILIQLQDTEFELSSYLNEFKTVLGQGELDASLKQLGIVEDHLTGLEDVLVKAAASLRDELVRCRVEFHEDPQISQQRATMRAVRPNSVVQAALKKLLFGRYGIVLAALGFVGVVAFGFGMKKVMELMEQKAKKLR